MEGPTGSSSRSFPSVSVVVPTYKEAESLPLLLDRLGALRDRLSLDLELLIMDDNSQDGTSELIQSKALPWVRLVVRTSNRGLSPSVVDGLKLATREVLVVMDADLSHPPERIPDLLDSLAQGNEFVIGSRYVKGASTDEAWGFLRWVNSKAATLMARPFTRLADPMSGFFAFRRSLLDRADALNPIGYKIGLELLVKCKVTRAAEVPIHFAQRQKGESKLSLKEQLRYIQHLRRLFLYRYPNLSYLLQFLVVGASGILVNLLVLTILLKSGLPLNASVALAIGLSMLSNFAANRRFTFSYARGGSMIKQLLGYIVACSLGAAVNYGATIWILATWPRLWPQAAALAGIIAGTGINYIACRFAVFQTSPPSQEPSASGGNPQGGKTLMCWALGPALLLVGLAAGTIPHQSIWIDETTQLSGLTLPPLESIRWLAGEDQGRFGVPGDRTPPLSYLAGKLWTQVFPMSEASLRWMGVTFTALGAFVVALTAGLVTGPLGSLVAGLAFACSPNVLSIAVQIRAYPIFLFTSACSFYAFTRIVTEPRTALPRWAALLTVALVASMYTHFFGVVLAGSLWIACLVAVVRQKQRVGPVVLGALATAILSVGLIPFVRASMLLGKPIELPESRALSLVRLLYRFFGHSSIGTSPVVTAVACTSTAVLLILALVPRRSSTPPIRAWALALGVGLLVTVASGLAIQKFNALQPTYSTWVLAGLPLLIAGACLVPGPRLRALSTAMVLLFLASEGYGDAILETHGSLFSLGPYRRLSQLVETSSGKTTAVIHEGPEFYVAYFPLYYGYGARLPQFDVSPLNPVALLPVAPGGGLKTAVGFEALHANRLLVVTSEWLSASEQRAEILGRRMPIQPGPVARSLRESPGWRWVGSEQIVTTTATQVDIFERR